MLRDNLDNDVSVLVNVNVGEFVNVYVGEFVNTVMFCGMFRCFIYSMYLNYLYLRCVLHACPAGPACPDFT